MLQNVSIEAAESQAEHLSPLRPVGAVAALLAERIKGRKAHPLVYIARTSRRREDIARLLRIMTDADKVAEFVPHDGFPGDGIPASAAAMGGRMGTLRWLCDAAKRPAIVLTTAAAIVHRVPPRASLIGVHLEFAVGEAIDTDAVEARLLRIGYRCDERVDEPGEFAIRGRVLEIFPAAAPRPCRVEHEEGRIEAIRSYDPATQRSVAESRHLIVDPASELLPLDEAADMPALPDGELRLVDHYGEAETLFDYVPDAETILETEADQGAEEMFRSLAETIEEGGDPKLAADYLDAAEWSASVGGRLKAVVEEAGKSASLPVFARQSKPFAALADFAAPLLGEGWRLVVAGPGGGELRKAARRAARTLHLDHESVADWAAIGKAASDAVLSLDVPIAESFLAAHDKIVVVSLRDLAGQRVGAGSLAEPELFSRIDETFRIGDAVVHLDHGVGILEGLEPLSESGNGAEALRLRYGEDDTLLVPLDEIGALWRYGGPSSDVKLDRLKGRSWEKRRNDIMLAITRTAERMVEILREREAAKAPVLRPDRSRYERFCARFPYELTPDQEAATGAVLADLEAGKPMDRLVCGDVGFGKTEVALRAAAAAVFAGRQVAIVAPTTILAQQHFRSFQARFARQGVEVVRMSRLADAGEMDRAKTMLADGSAAIVVGTHAILAEDLAFKNLALVVIDEEQRFGAAHKQALRALGTDIHVLTMTATPIPRTLQAGLVGLHDVSVVATPPGRRRPVRTQAGPFDEEAVRDALVGERSRGGQSFVVCPRIEDLEPMAERLRTLLPELRVTVLHGQMGADELDDAMLAFSRGDGDVLLSTSIVESGLDVPAANTLIVWRADRFGLSQLHQLRGRVGRGTRRGLAMLTTDPGTEPTAAALKRLETLCEASNLGAGFDIAARDLDLRGTGELVGEEQAGHLQLIGLSLYRRTIERALQVAHGQTPPDDWRPDLNLGIDGSIPQNYVPEADLRIEFAMALERIDDMLSLDALHSEVEDRFGKLPDAVEKAFALARLRLRCKDLGIRRLDAGPKAVAATFANDDAAGLKRRIKPKTADVLRWSGSRLIMDKGSEDEADRLTFVNDLLELLDRHAD